MKSGADGPSLRTRFELFMVGELDAEVRRSMLIDLSAAGVRSVMTAIIAFIPLILKRSGAST